jgi:hypothetical protein
MFDWYALFSEVLSNGMSTGEPSRSPCPYPRNDLPGVSVGPRRLTVDER